MQAIQNSVVATLESVKETLEKRDEAVAHREKVLAPKIEPGASKEDIDKFKQVSLELLDIGIYYGSKGVEQIKSYQLYHKVDAVVNFDDKFALVKNQGLQLYTYLDSKFAPIIENVFFLYDSATQRITSFIKVITDKHDRITEYVNKTYSSVKVITQDTWMRLDFDNDGSISVDDLKKSMVSLYEFLKNFDVIEATTTVKSKLYTDAIAYMQNELDEDQKQK
jgi:hypothetical protein